MRLFEVSNDQNYKNVNDVVRLHRVNVFFDAVIFLLSISLFVFIIMGYSITHYNDDFLLCYPYLKLLVSAFPAIYTFRYNIF